MDETCWKSTYVSSVYEGSFGDDSLGYDFEVPRDIYCEVRVEAD